MLSSRLDAPAHHGDATPGPGSAAVSAMATPRSMGRGSVGDVHRGSAGDSMTSSRTLTVAGDAASGHGGGGIPQRKQRNTAARAAGQGTGRGSARRQPSRRVQPQAQPEPQPQPASATEDPARAGVGSQHCNPALLAKQPLPLQAVNLNEVRLYSMGFGCPHRMVIHQWLAREMQALTEGASVQYLDRSRTMSTRRLACGRGARTTAPPPVSSTRTTPTTSGFCCDCGRKLAAPQLPRSRLLKEGLQRDCIWQRCRAAVGSGNPLKVSFGKR